MAGNLDAPLAVQDAPDLGPLRASHEADKLEAELKALFMAMFGQYVRPGLTALSTVGAPHLGDLDQLERAAKVDGIAIQRTIDEGAMRHLHKAFRARNPKRGMHMLRAYLQATLGDGWSMNQMWHAEDVPYPQGLETVEAPGRYLTSRVHVQVSATGAGGRADILAQSLRSVIPARIVLDVVMTASPFSTSLRMAAGMAITSSRARFIGSFMSGERALGAAAVGYASGERARFNGDFT